MCVWGRTMWRLFSAWLVVRITGSIPLGWFGGDGLVEELAVCPLCSQVSVDLEHILAFCMGTGFLRGTIPISEDTDVVRWVLLGSDDVDTLYKQVRYFGTCIVTCMHAAKMHA